MNLQNLILRHEIKYFIVFTVPCNWRAPVFKRTIYIRSAKYRKSIGCGHKSLASHTPANNSSPASRPTYPTQIYRMSSAETSSSDISHDACCITEIAIWNFERVRQLWQNWSCLNTLLHEDASWKCTTTCTQLQVVADSCVGRRLAKVINFHDLPCGLLSMRLIHLFINTDPIYSFKN